MPPAWEDERTQILSFYKQHSTNQALGGMVPDMPGSVCCSQLPSALWCSPAKAAAMLVFCLRRRCAVETTVLLRDSLISCVACDTRHWRIAISGESGSEPSTLTAPVSRWTRAEIPRRLPRTITTGG